MIGASREVTPPYTLENLDEFFWDPQPKDFKTYRHFDRLLNANEIRKLVRSKERVAQHTFRPLLHFVQKWRRPPKNGVPRKPKEREIRYACRRDAYIFKNYREILSLHYENLLKKHNLSECVLAYRKIPDGNSKNNKSNIEFARDAFEKISALQRCCAIALEQIPPIPAHIRQQ